VKTHQLVAHLRRHGCHVHREGGRHTIWLNPSNDARVPVPRHSEIDNRLAVKICH
jgi:hypothetical protein